MNTTHKWNIIAALAAIIALVLGSFAIKNGGYQNGGLAIMLIADFLALSSLALVLSDGPRM